MPVHGYFAAGDTDVGFRPNWECHEHSSHRTSISIRPRHNSVVSNAARHAPTHKAVIYSRLGIHHMPRIRLKQLLNGQKVE